jgi:predicted nucleotidyltransferase
MMEWCCASGGTGGIAMSQAALAFPRDEIAALCRRRHIRRLALFGSALGERFGPESDTDLLVEFEPGFIPGLAFFAIQDELSELLGRPVDLNTPGFLSPHFREDVERDPEVLFAAE